jgi:hypothetical protein
MWGQPFRAAAGLLPGADSWGLPFWAAAGLLPGAALDQGNSSGLAAKQAFTGFHSM